MILNKFLFGFFRFSFLSLLSSRKTQNQCLLLDDRCANLCMTTEPPNRVLTSMRLLDSRVLGDRANPENAGLLKIFWRIALLVDTASQIHSIFFTIQLWYVVALIASPSTFGHWVSGTHMRKNLIWTRKIAIIKKSWINLSTLCSSNCVPCPVWSSTSPNELSILRETYGFFFV